ncbi:MAG: hypothetical protein IIB36_12440 [Gemmatimonadetes bacterium]|nr:hypothetical protein [Gemmatimonadota bacterium]
MILTLKILGAVLALALGVWLGLPGRYTQRIEDIEDVMERGGGRRRRSVKRSISPVAWLQRQPRVRSTSRGRGFNVEGPEDR